MTKKEKAQEIWKRLKIVYPQPYVELDFKTPWELLVATILAAQATDKVVNTMTPGLFNKFPTISDFAQAKVEDIVPYVKKVLFHNNKAKSIQSSAKVIMEKFNGIVPQTIEDLVSLPGVARKTANVVLNYAYKKPQGIVVDTHGIRMSQRLGLSSNKDPKKIEQDLMELYPQDMWIDIGCMLTLHGRHTCVARAHECVDCPLGDLCPEHQS